MFGITTPLDSYLKHSFGFFFAEEIFQFTQKAVFWRTITWTFIDNMTDMSCQGNVTDELFCKNDLALKDVGIHIAFP